MNNCSIKKAAHRAAFFTGAAVCTVCKHVCKVLCKFSAAALKVAGEMSFNSNGATCDTCTKLRLMVRR